jgi:glucose-6-phosphate dehydrogenase assembly protein OpcA
VKLADLAGELGGAPSQVADLSWTRLALWQQLVAEAFDEPHCATALARFDRVEIVYGCGAGAKLRAQLFGGWLAAQLAWSPVDARQRIHLSCRDDRDTTAVGLISITLRGESVEVHVHKNHGEHTATVVVNVPDACGLPRRRAFAPADDAALLSQALDQTTAGSLYLRALQMAGQGDCI